MNFFHDAIRIQKTFRAFQFWFFGLAGTKTTKTQEPTRVAQILVNIASSMNFMIINHRTRYERHEVNLQKSQDRLWMSLGCHLRKLHKLFV